MGALIKNAGLWLCAVAGRLHRPRGVSILVYHSIDDSGSYMSTPPELFTIQMQYLRDHGVRAISIRELLQQTSAGNPPANVVGLTFDDGLCNFADAAWSVIRDCGFTATVYVPTTFIGGRAAWYDAHGLPPMACMDADTLRALHAEGVDIESHGHTHRDLDLLPPEEARAEAATSRTALEDILGGPVLHFAYPYGDANGDSLAAVAAAGYDSAAVLGDARFQPDGDRLAIPRESLDRIRIASPATARLSMAACVAGTYSTYVRAKARVRRPFATPPHERGSPGGTAAPSPPH